MQRTQMGALTLTEHHNGLIVILISFFMSCSWCLNSCSSWTSYSWLTLLSSMSLLVHRLL